MSVNGEYNDEQLKEIEQQLSDYDKDAGLLYNAKQRADWDAQTDLGNWDKRKLQVSSHK